MKPIVFVMGMARSGTSLTMQMLHAAGIPCAGDWPAFEPDEINPVNGIIDNDWLRQHQGHAIKWLDPFRNAVTADVDFIAIWLDRDPAEQAKSQAKFAHMMVGVPHPNRSHMRRWQHGLRDDREKSLARIGQRPHLKVRFEALIDPLSSTVSTIAAFLEPIYGALDRAAMTAAIIRRPAECQPGLDIEVSLVERAERAA